MKKLLYLNILTCFLLSINLIGSDDFGKFNKCRCIKKKPSVSLDFCNIVIQDFPDFVCGTTEEEVCRICCSTPLRTNVHFRSQGANTARELVGWQWSLKNTLLDKNQATFYIAYEFQRSFRSDRLANSLFGGNSLTFSGSLVANRNSNELLADNFGLSRTFKGSIFFNPLIENHIVDLGYYVNLDCCLSGAYIRIHAPIVHTEWQLKACEVIESSTDFFNPCYVNSSSMTSTKAATSIKQALSGKFLFGDMQTKWCSGRFDFNKKTKTGLADIDFILGYNWFKNECHNFGGYIQIVFPTGSKTENLYIFEPIVGNSRHFEFGGGLSAHATLFDSNDHSLSFFLEGNVTHMFASRQRRLLDFASNGTFSRYLLLKEYITNGLEPVYNGNIISATCFNNREVKVKIDIKGDVSAKLSYRWCNFDFDVGYNVYGHTEEELSFACSDCCPIDKQKFAIKGTEDVCCSEYPVVCINNEKFILPNNFPVPIGTTKCVNNECTNISFEDPYEVSLVKNSSSQPLATAFAGKPESSISTIPCIISLGSESISVTQPTRLTDVRPETGFVFCRVQRPVKFVSKEDLSLRSGAALPVLSHKFFIHLNYSWIGYCKFNPFFGIGAEIEFDGTRINDLTCKKSGLNQWGLWIKGGLSY